MGNDAKKNFEGFAQQVLDASLNGVYVHDVTRGQNVFINKQYTELTGYSLADLQRMDRQQFFELFHPDDRPRVSEHLKSIVCGTSDVLEIEYRFQTKDGRWIWCLSRDHVLERDLDGSASQFLGAFLDITERKQGEAVLREYSQKLEREVKNRTAEIEKQYRQLEEMNRFIKQMTQHTIQTMENDRKALARQIHETVGGDLTAIKMKLEAGLYAKNKRSPLDEKSAKKIIGQLRKTMKDIRRLTYQMRSQVLDQFGLAAAIEEDTACFQKLHPEMAVNFQTDFAGKDIAEEIQTVLYRVFQEALKNIEKHSGADSVEIELKESEDRIVLMIRDNGCGFDVRRVLENRTAISGFGLLGMQERVGICKGRLEVRSGPGKGTFLLASIAKVAS